MGSHGPFSAPNGIPPLKREESLFLPAMLSIVIGVVEKQVPSLSNTISSQIYQVSVSKLPICERKIGGGAQFRSLSAEFEGASNDGLRCQ
ncbi:hypothetical protein AVEN_54339-1 [Araneus ventricosus]|uniref:Uncharacterized protein n=1 Tax=Araneus ventricosus TaxID=182803 RepID=A0A4Y2GFV4_ARAVE|nr:hypothetical protein AVEN_54339-1 [Araneus ventricosus]